MQREKQARESKSLPGRGNAGGKKGPDNHLQAATNDFQALEKLRRLAFGDEVPVPRKEQRLLDIPKFK